MFPMDGGETITVHPYVEDDEDDHGNPAPGFGPDRNVEGCGVEANGSSTEPSRRNRSLVVDELRIFAPHDIELGPQDEVTVRGRRYQVQGDPDAGRATNVFTGWSPGCEFIARKVEG